MYFIFLCCQHLWKSPFLNRARHKKLISRHRVVKHITDLAGSNNFIHRIWLFVTSKPNLSLLYSFISSWDLSPLCLSLSLSLSLWSKIYNLDMEVKIIPVTWNRKQHTHTHTHFYRQETVLPLINGNSRNKDSAMARSWGSNNLTGLSLSPSPSLTFPGLAHLRQDLPSAWQDGC